VFAGDARNDGKADAGVRSGARLVGLPEPVEGTGEGAVVQPGAVVPHGRLAMLPSRRALTPIGVLSGVCRMGIGDETGDCLTVWVPKTRPDR
jgi:hypothetical protein